MGKVKRAFHLSLPRFAVRALKNVLLPKEVSCVVEFSDGQVAGLVVVGVKKKIEILDQSAKAPDHSSVFVCLDKFPGSSKSIYRKGDLICLLGARARPSFEKKRGIFRKNSVFSIFQLAPARAVATIRFTRHGVESSLTYSGWKVSYSQAW